ncbi:DUF1178 family protein [Orrella sp. NBD-18]|uniref:DUF1178 family protein n=1 Tax=Sheuella amnicola TaxID=2707330 RepID=A0A6B2QXD4_9BURK|nr:DUF1178 family protein [Sheuella amnicola]NDY82663.1 DUF1178 family protein [Sheuella amnicola]HBI83281.1 DUF1178 domain-containing protein [Alcaligenaceae bacterium]
MGLKVFDLQCENGHLFEGWFGSHEDYDAQQARGLVTCPMCQSVSIVKRLSAPRLNVGHFNEAQRQASHQQADQSSAPSNSSDIAPIASQPVTAASPELAQLQAAIMVQMREFISKTENVGDKFAQEARRIHEGESEERPIRGTATREEREALAEEGIAVVALPDFLDTDRMQ